VDCEVSGELLGREALTVEVNQSAMAKNISSSILA
jgi:hypothetical protein